MTVAIQTIKDDVFPENVLEMVNAVEEFGHYPLREYNPTVTLYFSGIGSSDSGFTLTLMGGNDLPRVSCT
mgnify:CR=1 FL=1